MKKHRLGRNRNVKKVNLDNVLYILGFIITFLAIGAILIFSDINQDEIIPLPAPESGAVCGNGLVEVGENCGNCFLDVRCFPDEACVEGFCVEEKRSALPFLLILIFSSLLGIFFLGYKLIQRKKGDEGMDMHRISSLVEYMSRSMKSGHKVPEVRINALRAGWTERDVGKALKEAQRRLRI